MKKTVYMVALCMCAITGTYLFAHCQIPCGIYDDQMRFAEMEEHIQTIEKSMNQIIELSKAEDRNMNQIVRWVNNKDFHADELTHIVTYYFMAQRVKPVADKKSQDYAVYEEQLTLLHRIMVHTMQAKQTTDLEQVKALRELLAAFWKAYTR